MKGLQTSLSWFLCSLLFTSFRFLHKRHIFQKNVSISPRYFCISFWYVTLTFLKPPFRQWWSCINNVSFNKVHFNGFREYQLFVVYSTRETVLIMLSSTTLFDQYRRIFLWPSSIKDHLTIQLITYHFIFFISDCKSASWSSQVIQR